MRVLLTGFEPFDGSPINPSALLAQRISERDVAGCELRAAILPVDRWRGPAAVVKAIDDFNPDIVLSLGQASGRGAISIERVAVNLMDYRIADNAGHIATDEPIVPAGPAAYFATLPVREMCAAAQQAGVPAELSLSAGTYLCNQVLYTVLHHLERRPMRTGLAGFIHVPMLPEQAAAQMAAQSRLTPTPSMGLETMKSGVEAALEAALNAALNTVRKIAKPAD